MLWGSQNLPLKFKAWIGGVAPDYDSYTMIPITLGGHVENACPNIGQKQFTPTDLAPTDWIDIVQAPKTIRKGDTVGVKIEYNLVSHPEAEVQVSLQTWDWPTHTSNAIAGATTTITKGHFDGVLNVPVPADAPNGRDGIFFVVYFTPVGGDYANRLAEDRNYNTAFGFQTAEGATLGKGGNSVWNNIRGSVNNNNNANNQQQADNGGGLLGWVGGIMGGGR